MKWLEIIELRSAHCNRELLESQLQKLINEVEKETEKQVVKVYNRVMIDNDFSLHIFHDSTKVENCRIGRSSSRHLQKWARRDRSSRFGKRTGPNLAADRGHSVRNESWRTHRGTSLR